jgi:hypothetical protein
MTSRQMSVALRAKKMMERRLEEAANPEFVGLE